MFHRHRVLIFLANFIGEPLAPARLDRAPVITAVALQLNHRLCVVVPFGLQGFQALESVDLLRVVGHKILQIAQVGNDPRLGHFVRIKEVLVTGDQEPAHTRFQVNRQFGRLIEVVNDAVGVLHPLDHREQIGNQADEKHRAEHAHAQGQGHVTAQQGTKAFFIDGRRGCHGHALAKCGKTASLPE